MAEYRLSPAAERDLESIWIYTAQLWGAAQAQRYTAFLATTFQQLARSPQTAPRCDHIRPGYRRARSKQHMVYFRETDFGIAIIRVLHHRMDSLRRL